MTEGKGEVYEFEAENEDGVLWLKPGVAGICDTIDRAEFTRDMKGWKDDG